VLTAGSIGLILAILIPLWGGLALAAAPQDAVYLYEWQITAVGNTYWNYGEWWPCVTVASSPVVQEPMCTITNGVSVSNYLTGTAEMSDYALSEAVGWNVTWSGSVAVSDRVIVPANTAGTIQWARTFYNRRVTQQMCITLVETGQRAGGCEGSPVAYVTPREFRDIAYRFLPS
jgi:hypothetical protein